MGRNGGMKRPRKRTSKQEYMFRFAMRKRAHAIRRGEMYRILREVESEEQNLSRMREDIQAEAPAASVLSAQGRVRAEGA